MVSDRDTPHHTTVYHIQTQQYIGDITQARGGAAQLPDQAAVNVEGLW